MTSLSLAPITIQDVVSFLSVVLLIYISIKKTPVEIRKIGADADVSESSVLKTNAEQANLYAEATRTYAEEVIRLRQEVTTLNQKLDKAIAEMNEANRQSVLWKDYATVLAHQLRSHRITPESLVTDEDVSGDAAIPTTPRKKKEDIQ